MTNLEFLKDRRSIRSYTDEAVTYDQLATIMDAGSFAPTGGGRQSPVMVAVNNKALRDTLSRLNAAVMGKTDMDPFYGAPAVIVVLADPARGTYVEDGSLVMGNLQLAAHAMGLGSCWIHRAKEVFQSDEGKQILKDWGLEGYVGIGNCVIGHIKGDYPQPAERKEGYCRFSE